MPLVALSQHQDYDFPPGRFDVRGWNVRTLADNQHVGRVHDLLLDQHGEPRYLDIDLGLFRKHVLLPIGQARADRQQRIVWVPGFTRDQFREIPEYPHDLTTLTPRYESALINAYQSALAREQYRPRPSHAGAVYGPSELESRVIATPTPLPILAPLSSLPDFRIARHDPDPRGWTVLAADGRKIGSIDELIVDTRAMKVRYLVCRVNEEALGLDRQHRHILIPVGYARLDEDNHNVLLDTIPSSAIAEMPVYSGEQLTRELEAEVLAAYGPDAGSEALHHDPRFDPQEFYGPPTP